VVTREDPTECPQCGGAELEQDPDVLDTWFSSWLWPFSVFGWPQQTEDLRAFYPTHTLSTAPEILFFWVARMVMAGYEFMGEAPFTDVYLHGTVRDTKGRKMSKSLGNGIDPLHVVELFGADAMRFTLVNACAVGTDIPLDPDDVEGSFSVGRNFANKIWNAGRFALMSLGDGPVHGLGDVADDLALEDRWILSRFRYAVEAATDDLERFRLHEVAEDLYHFFWGEVCDWYLELVKARLAEGADLRSREAARTTLVTVLDGAFRLLHPIMPFVTSELWSRIPWPEGEAKPEDLIVAPWPAPGAEWADGEAEALMGSLQELIAEVRRLRKEYGVGEGQRVSLNLITDDEAFAQTVAEQGSALERLARVDEVSTSGDGRGAGAHAVLEGGTELFMPLEGVIDVEREAKRLRAEIEGIADRLADTEKKLANENFVSRAPAEVVDRERQKAEGLREQSSKLEEKLRSLEGAGS
jgi:valyl-tRNA synthetase